MEDIYFIIAIVVLLGVALWEHIVKFFGNSTSFGEQDVSNDPGPPFIQGPDYSGTVLSIESRSDGFYNYKIDVGAGPNKPFCLNGVNDDDFTAINDVANMCRIDPPKYFCRMNMVGKRVKEFNPAYFPDTDAEYWKGYSLDLEKQIAMMKKTYGEPIAVWEKRTVDFKNMANAFKSPAVSHDQETTRIIERGTSQPQQSDNRK